MKTITKSITILKIVLILLSSINISLSKNIYVIPNSRSSTPSCGDHATPCTNIKAALDVASKGDKILLQSGTYLGPLNSGLEINIEGLQIIGTASQQTIIDLQHESYAFHVTQPETVLSGVTIRNGKSLESTFAGGITQRLTLSSLTFALLLKDVVFDNIFGGAIMIETSLPKKSSSFIQSSFSSSPPTISNVVLQVQLSDVVFLNIAKRPALHVLGNIQVNLRNCNFQNAGLSSLPNPDVETTMSSLQSSLSSLLSKLTSEEEEELIPGAAIFVTGNTLGSKAVLTLGGCLFIGNKGVSIVHVGLVNNMITDELRVVGSNSFINNKASHAIIRTNRQYSLVVCLACNIFWNGNLAPRLCDVRCSLFEISSICPGSCSLLTE